MSRLWSLVLAAGQGRRLASLTGGIPKQFWSPHGDRTLLEHTLERLSPLVPPTRTVTVIDRSQRALAEALSSRSSAGRLLDQPADRGTAAGVLLGLTEIVLADPDALVVLTPSDHGVARPDEFRRGILHARDAITSGHASVVLCGVPAIAATGDYGWIAPGEPTIGACRSVGRFTEKPDRAEAERLLRAGAVWNTMVLVARASRLRDLFAQHTPRLTAVFDERARFREGATWQAFLTQAYATLPHVDFSRDVLSPAAADLSLYTWLATLGWTDLGTPARLVEWLSRADRTTPAAAMVA
jgi:mannose-1-phosphate guanylyltransferase